MSKKSITGGLRWFTAMVLAIALTMGLVGCSLPSLPGWSFNRGITENGGSADASGNDAAAQESIPHADSDLESFNQFTLEILQEELSGNTLNIHYYMKNPENYGINDSSVSLGDYEFESLGDTSTLTGYLNRLKTFDYAELSEEQQLIYDTLKYNLELELEYCDLFMYTTELTPYSGISVMLPTLFTNYEFYSKKDIEDYIALLNDTARYFGQVIQYEKLRSEKGLFMWDSVADEVISQCETFMSANMDENTFLISTFNSRLEGVEGLSSDEKAAYVDANRKAVLESFVPSYQILIDGVKSLKGTGTDKTLADTENGRKYYEYLIKSDFGWSKTMDELDSMLDQYITANLLYMQANASSLEDRYDDFSFSITDPEKAVEDLKKKLEEDFPEAPDVSYEIRYVDKSLEENANPAMYIVPQVDNPSENLIIINQSQLDDENTYTTLAHEGYPGHLYQNTYFASTNPNPIRRLLAPGAYSEGWATYIELYAYTLDDKAGNDSLYAFMASNESIIWGIYAKMDMGVNYYGWSREYLKTYLMQWGFGDSVDTDDIYNRLVAEPASYPRYGIGAFAFQNWKTTAKAALGNEFSARDFHKFILELGPVPFDIIDSKLQAWIAAQK
jgi:uncharacterized protein (DUF885 family)